MEFKPLTTEQLQIINAYHKWFVEDATDADRASELAYLQHSGNESETVQETSGHYQRNTENSKQPQFRMPDGLNLGN